MASPSDPVASRGSYRVGSRVLVETTTEWVPATCTGFRSGELGEDFKRVDVILDDGRRWNGCHPRHVRQAG
jgi:hypothetical protein